MRVRITLALSLVAMSGSSVDAEVLYGYTRDNMLFRFDSVNPGVIQWSAPIMGLTAGDDLRGVDFRRANGLLYALGSGGRLYTVDITTGAAAQVGTGAFSVPLVGARFGFAFGGTYDQIRIVSDAGQNMLVSPTTGQVIQVDAALVYRNGEPNVIGTTPHVVALDYGRGGASGRAIDSNLDIVPFFNPDTSGALHPQGVLGVDVLDDVGFTISEFTGVAFASLISVGSSGNSSLYRINFSTSAATEIGLIGGGLAVLGIAAPIPAPQPGALIALCALVAGGWRRRP